MIAGASQAGAIHILVPDDGKFTAATDKGYQNAGQIQGQTWSRSHTPLMMKQTYNDVNRMDWTLQDTSKSATTRPQMI